MKDGLNNIVRSLLDTLFSTALVAESLGIVFVSGIVLIFMNFI